MKKHFAIIFIVLGLCRAACGGVSSIYANYFTVDKPPVVDAFTFYNAGVFDITTVTSLSPTNLISTELIYGAFSSYPFMTKDTLNWTNASSGILEGVPGFQFDTGLSTTRHRASTFVNAGTVLGVDEEGFPYLFAPVGALAPPVVPVPALSLPIPSQVVVMSTNIVNTGSMTVGNYGVLSLTGIHVTNSYASLVAGSVNTAGLVTDPLDVTGLQGQESLELFNNGPYYFTPSPGVYDLFWGVTNALTIDLAGFDPPNDIPDIVTSSRNLISPGFPINFDTAQYSVTAILTGDGTGTNFWYNIVFVNTNFANTNLTATVGFSTPFFPQYASTTPLPTEFSGAFSEAIVQFAEPVYDIISGQTVTNGVYLIDDGAFVPTMAFSQNATLPGSNPSSGFERPNAFELTTETPFNWEGAALNAEANAFPYDTEFIWTPDQFSAQKVPFEISEYGAQIGHNPGDLAGSFDSLLPTNSFASDELDFLTVGLSDPSNEPARIEITASNLDLTQSRMRAEGMVIFNVTNLVGGGTATEDWGEMNANLGETGGALVISNLFPTTFQRVRGDVYAWSASWANVQTNFGPGTNAPVTNSWYYHVLVVDQNLFGSFPSTLRNLTLTGKSSVVLQDNMNIINQAVINTSNLTVNSSNYFSQNAATITPSVFPTLKNLFINTNGFLGSANGMEIGFNVNQTQGSPTGRKYSVNSITNFGQISSLAPLLKAANFENDGQIIAGSSGSIVIEANDLGLGLSLPNNTNYLEAGADVDLSAATIEASNSVISAGLVENGALSLEATETLSDMVSGIPTTNTNSVIVNYWTVTGGFSLPIKPATGDLFGTEIHTIATNHQLSLHVWAGTDKGAVNAGFVNNEVIGRLVLDRESTASTLRFSAAGAANAMYVDYLELTNASITDYRHGLIIDPNFKIYFADVNFDPEKLMEVYPNLIWVQTFAGPNSTQVVPYLNSTNVCLMNAALADSQQISFFNSVANYYNQPFVLNNPNNPTNFIPCSEVDGTELRSLLVATPTAGGGQGVSYNLLNISHSGEGSVTPELEASQIQLGNSYALTATPASGWVFQNWSTLGLNGSANVNSRTLTFNFISNTVITANFIPNPFGKLQGVYDGLFLEANGVDSSNSGFFTLTLQPSGIFSGRLLMGPNTYTFSSQFSGAGGAQVQAKSGAKSLTVNLQLDLTGQTGQILGDVNSGEWDSSLTANISPVWTVKNPTPLKGIYTMVLPWESGGDSHGAGNLTKEGVLAIAGKLADGVAFTATAPVSQDGQWPFYAYAPAGKDVVLGWVSVNNGLTGTNITWSKAAGAGLLYGAGFTTNLSLVGSTWQAPATKSAALSLADPTVVLSGGGLAEPLTISVALQNHLTYVAPNLSLSINQATGNFSGWFDNPGTGQKQTVSGVVLQSLGQARGFFQGANESGTVLLQDQ